MVCHINLYLFVYSKTKNKHLLNIDTAGGKKFDGLKSLHGHAGIGCNYNAAYIGYRGTCIGYRVV